MRGIALQVSDLQLFTKLGGGINTFQILEQTRNYYATYCLSPSYNTDYNAQI